MKIFYARVSTEDQNEARQIKLAEEYGADKVFLDKASGKNTDRPQLRDMLSFVRSGDVVICESFSRLARNVRDLLKIVEELESNDVEFISVKEQFETRSPQGKFMLTVFAAMYQMERESTLERQREGIEIAKAEGKYKGRKPIEVNERKMKSVCKQWRDGEITATEAMKRLKLKPNTFYRRVKEMDL